MKRKDFLAYLARAVSDKFLTEQEAVNLLRKFDAGEIDESTLPLPLEQAITETTQEDVRQAIIVLTTLGILSKNVFPRMAERQQEKSATRLQERFAENARSHAKDLIKSGSLPVWQTSMSKGIQEHIIQQSLMGRLRPLTSEEISNLDSVIKTQQAYLSRFAEEAAARYLLGNPFSEEYISSRSEQYNGEARAVFYREKEAESGDDEVFDYVSLDDNSTCQPCLDAEAASPYLPADGPMPGDVCEGRGFCRCVREARYAPDEAAGLRNELRAA